jgi:hypothetical protein
VNYSLGYRVGLFRIQDLPDNFARESSLAQKLIKRWDYWVLDVAHRSGIQNNTTFRKLDLFPSSGEGVGDTYSVGSVIKS